MIGLRIDGVGSLFHHGDHFYSLRYDGCGHTATVAAPRRELEAAGAQEIHLSAQREWANFKTANGTPVQLYWWQRDGVYYVVRQAASGGRLEQVGRFHDLDAAIALGMSIRHQGA
jgi:hypothetical protein